MRNQYSKSYRNSRSRNSYNGYRSKNSQRMRNAVKRVKEVNPTEWIKYLGIALLVFVVYKIFKGVGGFLGGVGEIGGSEFSDDPDSGSFDYGENLTPGDSGGSLAGDDTGLTNTQKQLRATVDLIHVKLTGYNAFAYPEVVNRLGNLNKTDLKYCCDYWNGKFKQGSGKRLYNFINSEYTGNNWIDGYLYEPALGRFIKFGLKNY